MGDTTTPKLIAPYGNHLEAVPRAVRNADARQGRGSWRSRRSDLCYCKAAFGAVERYRLEDDATHRVVVAQLAVGQVDFWLQEDPDSGPGGAEGVIRLILTVDDPDVFFRQAVAAGATEIAPISEDHGSYRSR